MGQCVQRLSDKRVASLSDASAKLLVDSGLWRYISKNKFKKVVKAIRKEAYKVAPVPVPDFSGMKISKIRQYFVDKRAAQDRQNQLHKHIL
jgi:hypothetical protein